MTTLEPHEQQTLTASGHFVRDGLLGPDAAHDVRSAVAGVKLRPATVVGAVAGARGDALGWLDRTPELGRLWTAFDVVAVAVARFGFFGLSGRSDIQLARYPGDGKGYDRHRDAVAGVANGRRLTLIYYLNAGWRDSDGGMLRLHLPCDTVDIEPLEDRLVVFLSEEIEHEVLPVLRPRLAITAWYYA